MLTRRKFNQIGLATIGSTILPNASFGSDDADIIVIGAGLSGLYSAMLLSQLGLNVRVLEAGSEVGGRVKTLNTRNGPLDVGASQIGLGYARVRSACRTLGLRLIPEDRDLLSFAMHAKGEWIEAKNWKNNPLNQCRGDERDILPMMMGRAVVDAYNPLSNLDDWLNPDFGRWDISLREFMLARGYSDQAIEFARWTTPGISLDDTSMLRMFQESTRGRYDRSFMPQRKHGDAKHPFGEENVVNEDGSIATISNIEGGCQRLPEAMARELPGRIDFGKKVRKIAMTKRGATIECNDGSRYRSRYVISAIPFTMLREVEINASNSPKTQKIIQEMPYANTARMYLDIEQPFWEEDGLSPSFSSDGPMGMFWAIDNHGRGPKHRAMIVLVGEAGRAITSKSNPEAFLLGELERLRPAAKGLVSMVAYKDWAADPLQKGCGFSMAPGQVSTLGRAIIEPWQVMHFAGEYTRRLDFGMESAMESGERVAREIAGRAGLI